MTVTAMLQVLSVLMVGLVAGLFYGYDCSVIGGLVKLGSKEYLMAFREINRAILNPYFFVSFMGALVVLPLAVWMGKGKVPDVSFYLMITVPSGFEFKPESFNRFSTCRKKIKTIQTFIQWYVAN